MQGLDRKLWQAARKAALERDRHRCTAAAWDATPCSEGLAVHHIDPETDKPYLLDGLLTLCPRHHKLIHVLMRENERRLDTLASTEVLSLSDSA